ncbi:hypothetical protein L6164_020228 [Bauhinia variegata]|uniref:Uncharacterized protein n=1 Tax=Bauhinia variegata TaxID=167791 RepID=A0ACB9MV73_BAUVA|nr:hypothetical protein L6164_020228 [Bauhinia variegata]
MKREIIATFSSKNSSRYGIRSISLPARSHPSTARIEEELNKLRSWEASSASKVKTICSGLSGLVVLYKCIEDLLKLPLTQQALAQHQNEKWVDELLDCPVKFLDVLGNTRDAILLLKGSVGELQSAVRRRKVGDLGIETHVSAYFSLRRNVRKVCTKSLVILKQMDASSDASPPLDLKNHVSAVVRVLREASLITSSIFQSLLLFLSSQLLKSKPSKWAFVSRLAQKGVLVCNNQQEGVNELEKVDFALNALVTNDSGKVVEADKIESAKRRLQGLVVGIEGIDNGLECLFRHLINIRVSFLNIISP